MGEKWKKKILYVITKSNFGGAQRYVFDLASALPKSYFNVTVVFGEGGELEQKLNAAGIRTVKLNSLRRDINPFFDIASFFSLLRVFKREKPDIVHLNSSKAGGLGALAARLAGVKKIIFTGHGWTWNEKRFWLSKKAFGFFHWLTILFSTQTIAVSEKIKSEISALPFARKKITVIHNGISPEKYLDKANAREKLQKNIRQETWIGAISELHKNKGLDLLIDGYKTIVSKFPNTALVIIGKGEERESLDNQIAKLELNSNVFLLGFVKDAAKYLKAFDIFALTSRTEGLPYVILEAARAEVPILASFVGGIPEIIENMKSGVLVAKGNNEKIADGLAFMLLHKEENAEFVKKLSATVGDKFSFELMVKKTEALYN